MSDQPIRKHVSFVLEREALDDDGRREVFCVVRETAPQGDLPRPVHRESVGMAFHDTTGTPDAWRAHFEERFGLDSVSADSRENLLEAARRILGTDPPARDPSRGGEVPLPARGGRPQPVAPAQEVFREGPGFSV